MNALSANNLSKQFRKTPVLNGLNFEVPEGSIFGLIGANGAGKTTTIKILMNMLKPTSGEAAILGTDSKFLSPSNLTQIGYVSENQEMPDWMTVDRLTNTIGSLQYLDSTFTNSSFRFYRAVLLP